MLSPDVASTPPDFVRLAAHPLRWSLLTALAGGDRRVRELVSLVGERQNLVSYHLRLLRDGGLVTTTRSSRDGRDTYYHLDLERCADALAGVAASLHPVLRRDPVPVGRARPTSVLFVCTGNSARSPIAEALLRHHAPGHVTATSAGIHPRERLHPHAVRILGEAYGLDVSGQRPRHVDTVLRRRFDHVVTLCDRAREQCPGFRYPSQRVHWSIPDPAAGDDGATFAAFEAIAADIDVRVRHLLPVLTSPDH